MPVEFDPTAFENFELSKVLTFGGNVEKGRDDEEEEEEEDQEEVSGGDQVDKPSSRKQAVVFVIDCGYNTERQLPQKLFESRTVTTKQENDDCLFLSGQKPDPHESSIWKVSDFSFNSCPLSLLSSPLFLYLVHTRSYPMVKGDSGSSSSSNDQYQTEDRSYG